MTNLIIEPHLEDPDGFYAALIDAHRDLSAQESVAMNARLVLLLANHVGRMDALSEALARGRESVIGERLAKSDATVTGERK